MGAVSMFTLRAMALIFATITVLAAMPAHALNAYRDESCTLKLKSRPVDLYSDSSQNNFVVRSGNQILDLDGFYERSVKGSERPTGHEDLVMKVDHDVHPYKQKFNDGCFTGEVGSMIRQVKVTRVSERARRLLRLNQGDKLHLQCQWEDVMPLDQCVIGAQPKSVTN